MRISMAAGVAVLGMALLLAGCATGPAVLSGYHDDAAAGGVTLVDARAPTDKTSEIGSLWITSCNYSIYRLGDERTTPSKFALLRHDLQEALGSQLAATPVTVTKYTLFVNARAANRRAVNGMYSGVVPGLLAAAGDGCKKEDTTGGWFDPSDLDGPDHGSAIVIVADIEVSVAGKVYTARVAVPSSGKALVGSDATPEIFDAMHKAHARLIAKLRNP